MAVVYLFGQGMERPEIARQLGILKRSVDGHLQNAKSNLDADSMEDLVHKAEPIIEPYIPYLDLKGRDKREFGHTGRPELTDTEQEVLEVYAEEGNAAAVAQKLDISENTAYVHLHHMRNKLAAANNEQLIEAARDSGMLPGPRTTI
jgi:DNA-binding CsgD family transcriptional regulator